MTFPYPINTAIPFRTNPPRNDQPGMLTNFSNINGFLGVDLVAPGTNVAGQGAGFHKQVTYFTANIPTPPLVDPLSVGFTANANNLPGNVTPANSANTVVQEFYCNANGFFPVVAIKAFGAYAPAIGTPVQVPLNAFNVSSVTRTGLGAYTVVLATGATFGNTYTVLVSNSTTPVSTVLIPTYEYAGANTFTIQFTRFNTAFLQNDPDNFSFAVLQV